MSQKPNRRLFLSTAGAALAYQAARPDQASAQPSGSDKIQILGINCSPRKGKTTAQALEICLQAARAVDERIDARLIELAGMNIGLFDPANPQAAQGGFASLIPVLTGPQVAAILVGTPVYFGNMTSLCKAFLDHCMAFRRDFALSGKVAGVVAVGGMRNGGQELTIQSVQAALLAQEMIVVGDGAPTGHRGATLWNQADDINKDELGVKTAQNLGRWAATVSLRLQK